MMIKLHVTYNIRTRYASPMRKNEPHRPALTADDGSYRLRVHYTVAICWLKNVRFYLLLLHRALIVTCASWYHYMFVRIF